MQEICKIFNFNKKILSQITYYLKHSSMKKIFYCTLLISTFSISFTSCKKKKDDPVAVIPTPIDTMNYDMNETAVINAGWTKTFNEDFNTDLSKWNIWNSGAYNNELQCYTPMSKNLSLNNGVLSITAIKENVTGDTSDTDNTQGSFNFTSGRIDSKYIISANSATPKIRYSARIKLPSGYGMGAAFWSYGPDWPTNGDITFAARGNLPLEISTNYSYGTYAITNQVSSSALVNYDTNIDLTRYWHVYEIIWEQSTLTFMLNGKVIRVLETDISPGEFVSSMFGKTQNIVLDLAVGGNYFNNPAPSTIVTGTMQVDWVRVFTSK
jgi:beta-glucanase (GH16 family)